MLMMVMNMNSQVESKGFRRWCIGLGITEFAGFVHRPEF
jgi:hypothetical protein